MFSGAMLSDAITAIDGSGLGVCFVVDAKSKLLGLLVDGDIRRGIVRGGSLSDQVDRFMNTDFIFGWHNDDRAALLQKMVGKGVECLPIVDDNFRLVDVFTCKDFERQYDNTVVLMAGGLGARLRPLTENTPKPMLEIGGQPILETIIKTFVRQGFKRFAISIRFKGEKIKEYFGGGEHFGVEIKYIEEKVPLGTAGALSMLDVKSSDPIIVMNGDILTQLDFAALLENHLKTNSLATMCVRSHITKIPFGVVTCEQSDLLTIQEKPSIEFMVNAGVYVITPTALTEIQKGEKLDMTTFFERLLSKKKRVGVFPIYEYWTDIGRKADLNAAENYINENIKSIS